MLRAIFVAALAAGTSFVLAGPLGVTGDGMVAWKGAGVTLLALWCAVQAQERDGWTIAAVMAFGALGDVLIEWRLEAGAAAFAVGHVLAIALYVRNRRATLSRSQMRLAIFIAPATVFTAWMLTFAQPGGLGVVIYAVLLGMMASCAWVSRFPRYRTGLGAVLFAASDLAIFDGLRGGSILGWTIWPLYFAGQALIAYGVVRTLSTDARGSMP
jgi:uncharacterized membrane protein YhhN